MVYCFVPECNHAQLSHSCKFFRFPKAPAVRRKWITLIRRKDRDPDGTVRVCSCHFRDRNKANGPELFKWNEGKLFPVDRVKAPRAKKTKTMNQMPSEQASSRLDVDVNSPRPSKHPAEIENIILKAELAKRERETQELKEQLAKKTAIYSAENLGEDVIKMETGLNRHVFDAVVRNVESCKLNYHAGWKVESLSMENQVLITLMKARQNYTNLHLAQLFACSTRTISNIVITLFYVLHKLLYKDCMSTVPSRLKNSTSLPDSFSLFANCRMIFDCTDVKVATPALMSEQKLTYSTYRGMNSFKVLLGVAPNAVITFVSKLYPGSVSDKAIVEDSGLANVFEDGDLVLADKGFLIHDIMPDGVSVNIPPFLNKGKFSESEIKLTKSIAKCRIHVERANARLKDFQILSFIPPYLRVHADKIVQLCAALVNLQNPLIKEISDTIEFD